MRKAVIIIHAFGAVVIAHPHVIKAFRHVKRTENGVDHLPVHQYQDSGAWIEDYVQTVTVTVQVVQPPSPTPYSQTLELGYDVQVSRLGANRDQDSFRGHKSIHNHQMEDDGGWDDHKPSLSMDSQATAAQSSDTTFSSSLESSTSLTPFTAQVSSPSPAASSTTSAFIAPPVSSVQQPIDSSTSNINPTPTSTMDNPSAAVSTGSSPSASNQSGGSAADWVQAPNSQGVNILAAANKMRKAWMPNTTDFQWSPLLAANARLTAVNPNQVVPNGMGGTVPSNEVGATVMNHHLYDCSTSQCIASGDAVTMNGTRTAFESAWRMWLCEIPAGGIEWPCDSHVPASGPDATGHAQIIEGDVDLIGCYYMDAAGPVQGDIQWKGLWTCDFAKSVQGGYSDCPYLSEVSSDYTGASTQGSTEAS